MKLLTVLACTSMFCLTPVDASAQSVDLTMAVGMAPVKGKGGGYYKKGEFVKDRMKPDGYNISLTPTQGSDEITRMACRENADIWIAQEDAVWLRLVDDKCTLKPAVISGTEYTFLMFPPGSKNSKLSHITAKDKISVGDINSGSRLTWANWTRIEKEYGGADDWIEATQVYDVPVNGLTAAAQFGDVTAVFLVRGPKSDDIAILLDEGWKIGYAWDRDINDLEFNDRSLYEWASDIVVPYKEGKDFVEVETFEIPSYVGLSPENEMNRQLKTDLVNSLK